MQASELDINIMGAPVFARGLSINLGGTGTMPDDGIGCEIHSTGTIAWNRGLYLGIGSSTRGIVLDSMAAAVSQESQTLEFVGKDGAGEDVIAVVKADAQGNLVINPATNAGVLVGAIAIIPGSVDPTAGGGVAAPLGSLYLRTTGAMYLKTGSGNTQWTSK